MNCIEIPSGRNDVVANLDTSPIPPEHEQLLTPNLTHSSTNPDSHDTEDKFHQRRPSYTLICLACFGGLGGLLFGYDTGVISGALPYIRDDILTNYATDPGRLGWIQEVIVTAAIFGAGIGSACGGLLADFLGRRFTLFISDGLFTGGALLMAFAASPPTLIFGRVIVGLGVGLASVTVPLYIAEAAPAHIRAVLVTVNVLMITSGQLLAYVVDFAFTFVAGTWRWMLGVAAVPAVVQLVGLAFLPESPRWLRKKGHRLAALSAEAQLWGHAEELSALGGQADEDASCSSPDGPHRSDASKPLGSRPGLWAALRQPGFQGALHVGVGLQVLQQLCGINTVMYYAPVILEAAGMVDKRTALLWALLPAAVNAAGTVLGMFVIDSFGRRKLLLMSLGGVVAALAILGVTFKLADDHSPMVEDDGRSTCSTSAFRTLPSTCAACLAAGCLFCQSGTEPSANGLCLTMGAECPAVGDFHKFATGCPNPYSMLILWALLLYLICFSPGLGPVPWAVNAEIYPVQLGGLGAGIAATANWLTNALVSQTFLSMLHYVGRPTTFWIYSGIASLGMLWVFLVLPETKGLSLEEVHKLFQKTAPGDSDWMHHMTTCTSGEETAINETLPANPSTVRRR